MPTLITILLVLLSASSLAAATPDLPAEAVVSAFPRGQIRPAAASDGQDFLIAWSEETAGGSRIAASRVSSGGSRLDGSGVEIATASSFADVAVTYGGQTWLVLWTDGGNAFARRFRRDLSPVDATPLLIENGAVGRPAAAWQGTSFYVVWQHLSGLRGSFLPEDGPATAPVAVAGTTPVSKLVSAPSVAWNGSAFFVAWNTYHPVLCTCVPTPLDAEGIIVGGDGTAAGPVFTIATNTRNVSVASNGVTFLAVVDTLAGFTHAYHVTEAGLVPRTHDLFRAYGVSASNVVFDGTDYVIGTSYGAFNHRWLASMRMTPNNFVLRFEVVEVGLDGSPDPLIGMAVNRQGRWILAVSESDSGQGPARVESYFDEDLGSMPPPPPPPWNVAASGNRDIAFVTWEAADGIVGFEFERNDCAIVKPATSCRGTAFMSVDGNARSATVRGIGADTMQLRAFGPGGYSLPSRTIVISSGPRRRPTH